MPRTRQTGRTVGMATLAFGVVALIAGSHACAPSAIAADSKPPASLPAPARSQFEDRGGGVRFQFPSDWHSVKDPDYVLMLLPAEAKQKDRRIAFDIPDLPPHLPGMIKLGLIQNGYVSDLKKEHKDVKIDSSADVKVPGASARLLRTSWHQNGQPWIDVALLMIHKDRVFILNLDSDDPHLAATRAAFDSIQSSLQWTK